MGKPTLADVLRLHGQDYLRQRSLSTPQAKAWRAICACRTAAMGGQQLACNDCGHNHWQYHSCRNRHCPSCGARAKDAWLQARVAQVLDVPYTHRTAISNERILRLQGDEVVISARAQGSAGEQGHKRTVRMCGTQFIGRFMQHVLPTGLKRIRHYGLLANPNAKQLAQAKALLHMPAPNPVALQSAQAFMARVAQINTRQCPACEHGRMGVVQTCKGHKRLPDPWVGQERRPQHTRRAPPAQGP